MLYNKNKKNDYFLMLYELTGYCNSAAEFLNNSIKNLNLENIKSHVNEIHKIEHAADIAQHELIGKLSKEFLTPIEREDIMLLAQNIDNVTDAVESVLLHFYMYNIEKLIPEAFKLTDLICKSCKVLQELMKEFQKFKKSEKINDLIIKLNDLESEGDDLYTQTMHNLYLQENKGVYVLKWTNILNHFENCLDSCENVSGLVKRVIMANS